MDATRNTPNMCKTFAGRPGQYQDKAAQAYYVETSFTPGTWEWITTTCGTEMCLNPEHMKFHAPTRLAYPEHVCIYCGLRAYTRDHLIPKQYGGPTKRPYVVTVPACGTCNSLLGDTLTWSITERRAIAHARMRKHYRKVLATVEWGQDDLDEMGESLRAFTLKAMADKAQVMDSLEWPRDPAYDRRAIEKSGIEDPWAVGLIIDQGEADRIAREVCAPPKRPAKARCGAKAA